MDYLDFDLEIGVGNGMEYPLIARSPAGEAREIMHFPYDRDRMDLRLKDLTIALLQSASIARQVLPPELQSVQDMGKDFFNAIFTGDIRTRYDLSHRMAQEQGKGLRVRLNIQSGVVSALPWEYLFDPRSSEYLCLSASTPLVRYLEVSQAVMPISVDLPLRVLGMVCSPTDLRQVDFDREKQRVEEALADLCKRGLVELVWLSGETWSDLQDALLEGPWHVFHFIGHGDFDAKRDEGFLALTGKDGKALPLHATELARLLADHRELRVVVLNACQGARSSWQSVYSSVAAVLVRRGIACTIAMQCSITNSAAVELARRFYIMLAKGLPVDAALTEARKGLSIAFPNSVEWGTPVLYMRSPDGRLFDPRTSGQSVKPAAQEAAEDLNSNASNIAGDFVKSGLIYAGLGQYEQAIQEYTRALKLNSQDAASYFNRGLAYAYLGQHERAIQDFNRTLEISPRHSPGYYNRGLAHANMGRHKLAIQDYNQALSIDPKYTNAYINRGESYAELRLHEEAIKDFSRALEIDPKFSYAFNNRGKAYARLGQLERAVLDFNRALEVTPGYADAFFNRGLAYASLTQYDLAIADFTHSLEINPHNADAHFFRGVSYSCLNRPEQAVYDFTRALEINPKYVHAHNNRGNAYADLGQYERSIIDYTEELKINPRNVKAYSDRGFAYEELGRHEAAVNDYTQVIKLNPQDSSAYIDRGIAYVGFGRHKQAIQDYSQALAINPRSSDAFFNRGSAYASLGEHKQAIDDYTQALEINPKDVDALKNRGLAHLNLKQYKQAVQDYTRAVEINPMDADIYYARALAYQKLLQNGKAITDLRKSIELSPNVEACNRARKKLNELSLMSP